MWWVFFFALAMIAFALLLQWFFASNPRTYPGLDASIHDNHYLIADKPESIIGESNDLWNTTVNVIEDGIWIVPKTGYYQVDFSVAYAYYGSGLYNKPLPAVVLADDDDDTGYYISDVLDSEESSIGGGFIISPNGTVSGSGLIKLIAGQHLTLKYRPGDTTGDMAVIAQAVRWTAQYRGSFKPPRGYY